MGVDRNSSSSRAAAYESRLHMLRNTQEAATRTQRSVELDLLRQEVRLNRLSNQTNGTPIKEVLGPINLRECSDFLNYMGTLGMAGSTSLVLSSNPSGWLERQVQRVTAGTVRGYMVGVTKPTVLKRNISEQGHPGHVIYLCEDESFRAEKIMANGRRTVTAIPTNMGKREGFSVGTFDTALVRWAHPTPADYDGSYSPQSIQVHSFRPSKLDVLLPTIANSIRGGQPYPGVIPGH